ncbi:MAG: DUF4389 domain-containing protein [Candidatus Micrarchaeota archaeon]|nr:DUF4389 domain-containing protein [Candidatus Micrarchaeota archaeon]
MGKTVDYSVRYVEKASRVELFVRLLWAIPSVIIAVFLAIVYVIANTLQFLHILLLGTRHRTLHNWIFMFLDYEVKLKAYMALLTDERNPLMPEN